MAFVNVRFAAAAFDNAKFEGDAVFEQVVFAGDTAFRQATFHGAAVFEDVRFGGDARFEATRFGGRAVFAGSEFSEDARFSETEFAGDAVFHRVTFAGLARFGQARFFDGIRFRETRFDRELSSSRAVDAGTALLEREPCWVRTDVPATVAPRRMRPAGWTLQPTPDHPTEDTGPAGANWCPYDSRFRPSITRTLADLLNRSRPAHPARWAALALFFVGFHFDLLAS